MGAQQSLARQLQWTQQSSSQNSCPRPCVPRAARISALANPQQGAVQRRKAVGSARKFFAAKKLMPSHLISNDPGAAVSIARRIKLPAFAKLSAGSDVGKMSRRHELMRSSLFMVRFIIWPSRGCVARFRTLQTLHNGTT